jgi:hypothetical protein
VCYSVFLQGVDYGIVMPSMLNYMQSHEKNVSKTYFGAAVSSFSIASLVTAPAVGCVDGVDGWMGWMDGFLLISFSFFPVFPFSFRYCYYLVAPANAAM